MQHLIYILDVFIDQLQILFNDTTFCCKQYSLLSIYGRETYSVIHCLLPC